ncbi:septum formation protein [Arboricoccus pini]|uniref:Nucleoside triphosphate pyrophosphatase n=1 Tax=Arboricoccus pini TaxID=1963835 RepID=A0A212QST2_9PROT|nr:nucleoside triphosphate pyrophosphatase [Arboricoccus pini]SNB62684.1 septum formation protein [Arboricoccus pini]
MSAANSPPVILASGSITRAALLRAAGIELAVQPPLVDEVAAREALAEEGANARDAATALAELKAAQVSRTALGGSLVLAADQILDVGGSWIGKASDRFEARQHLQLLRGRAHQLWSAAVLYRDGTRIWHAAEVATLHMRAFSNEWLETYLEAAGDAILQSVGCYQIEGLGSQMMTRMEGSYFAILGLPLLPLLQALRDHDILGR